MCDFQHMVSDHLTGSDEEDDEPLSVRQERKRKAEKPVSSDSEDYDEESGESDDADPSVEPAGHYTLPPEVATRLPFSATRIRARCCWQERLCVRVSCVSGKALGRPVSCAFIRSLPDGYIHAQVHFRV